ncbi:MAG: hypothetical protein ABSH14_07090 [Verrucomicrobiia bacterium]|jgi:hypothetical protein
MGASKDECIPIDQALTAELETDPVLGGKLEDEKFVAKPAEQPIALKLRDICETLKRPVPPEVTLYEMFEVWLVPHRVSIIRRRGKAEATSIGIQIEYIHKDTTCSVISLIPSPQFVHHGTVGFQGLFQGKVSAAGNASPTPEDLQFNTEKALGKLSIGVMASGEVGFRFKAEVVTPFIAAVGIGDSSCEWRFDKHEDALFGKDIETWTMLALPKTQTKLSYRLRYYICTRTLFVPTRRQSEWVEIACALS